MSDLFKTEADGTRVVALEKPYEGHHGMITEIRMRPPTFKDFIELGDPTVLIVVARGMVPQEDLATIAKYIARLGGGDTARLETNGTLRDAMALRDAVKSFFDRASASGSTAPPIS